MKKDFSFKSSSASVQVRRNTLEVFLSILSNQREGNIVKIDTDVRKTLNVTCGKFERPRDSDINGMIFRC